MQRKAQIIPEFIIITAIVLGAMLFVFMIAAEKSEESIVSQRYLRAKSVCDEMSLAINQVHFGGPETKRVHWLPLYLENDINYSLYIIPSARVVRITWNSTEGEQIYDSSLLTSNINATSLPNISQFYYAAPGEINIANKGGIIKIEHL